jgi:hypothetical protein
MFGIADHFYRMYYGRLNDRSLNGKIMWRLMHLRERIRDVW